MGFPAGRPQAVFAGPAGLRMRNRRAGNGGAKVKRMIRRLFWPVLSRTLLPVRPGSGCGVQRFLMAETISNDRQGRIACPYLVVVGFYSEFSFGRTLRRLYMMVPIVCIVCFRISGSFKSVPKKALFSSNRAATMSGKCLLNSIMNVLTSLCCAYPCHLLSVA